MLLAFGKNERKWNKSTLRSNFLFFASVNFHFLVNTTNWKTCALPKTFIWALSLSHSHKFTDNSDTNITLYWLQTNLHLIGNSADTANQSEAYILYQNIGTAFKPQLLLCVKVVVFTTNCSLIRNLITNNSCMCSLMNVKDGKLCLFDS